VQERSAGAVVFRESDSREYLLLLNAGRWDFAKGNIERGESEMQAAMREVGEETGLKSVRLVEGFRRVVRFFYRREGKTIYKEVVYFLGRAEEGTVKVSFEHQDYGWFKVKEALSTLSYENSRKVLRDAEGFLKVRTESAGGARRASPP